LTQHGIPTIGIGGVWNWLIKDTCVLLPEFDQVAFVDRSVLIIFDSDTWVKEEIQRALYALGKAIENRGGRVEALIIPPATNGDKQGADDFILANGIGKFKELKRIKLRHDGLSQHKPWWEKWREKKSKDEKEISKLGARLVNVEPWELPVDGAALLDEIRATFQRFIVTVEPAAVTVETLWVVLAHAIDAFGIAPVLAFWSPLPECGKTINQSIVGKLVPKPLEGSNLTEAIVFRVVEKFKPTVLVDEAADLMMRPELLSLFRASHQKNKAFVFRTVGDAHEPTDFSTWAPKSLAITKTKIESALASRCLIVRMHRKTRGEKTERFKSTREYPELEVLRRKAARWARDNFENLKAADPQNIPDLENRNLDNYEPLFQIAHVAGGQWPQLIHDAAVKLVGGVGPVEESISMDLLRDIKSIFAEGDFDRITSAELVQRLVAKEERPWTEYNKGKPITQNQVSRLLKDFMIYSRNIREPGDIEKKVLKGYLAAHFADAFSRYIPPKTVQDPVFTEFEPQHRYTGYKNNDLGQKPEPLQGGSVAVGENDLSKRKEKGCSGVAVQISERQGSDMFSTGTEPNGGTGFDPNYPFPGESVDDFWTRIKADHAARKERA
jgi:putative DNA primase/helicase